MSSLGVLDTGVTVTTIPTFAKNSAGLWDAIVDNLAPRDPAGSALVGPAWPGQPVLPEPGMFDFVRS